MNKQFLLTLIIVANIFYSCEDHPVNDLPEFKGPKEISLPLTPSGSSWTLYHNNQKNGIAILLTDTSANWLGLVHAFKTFGIPFTFCTNAKEAVMSPIVFIYPTVSSRLLDKVQLEIIKQFTKEGGTVIAADVTNALTEFCGIKSKVSSNQRYRATISNDSLFNGFSALDKKLFFADQATYPTIMNISGYIPGIAQSLIQFDDNTSLLTKEVYGNGKIYALGIDLGYFAQRCYASRAYGGPSNYVNGYLPTLDVLIRIIKKVYEASSNIAVTLGTVPFNKDLTICITHDVDYVRSIENAVDYSNYEKEQKIPATYFIQVKYVKDYNDDIFFNSKGISLLKKIYANGMEIGSHTISHSRKFSKFEYGTGKETYPDYKPFVKNESETEFASIMGELRVSKFLLEQALDNKVKITSFRSGYLSSPQNLPQALLSSGYKCTSNETQNSVLTHLPYQLNYNRGFDQQLDIFEYPITIEDEEHGPMFNRVDSGIAVLNNIAGYGGFACLLIHPDILGQKLDYEKKVIATFKDRAYFSTLGDFDNWWKARNAVTTNIIHENGGFALVINAPFDLKGLTVHIPQSWKLINENGIRQVNDNVILDDIQGEKKLHFTN